MLDRKGISYRYREYTREPLSAAEIRQVLRQLGLGPKQVLRKMDKAFRQLGLTGHEAEEDLIRHMSEHPTLLQRPIALRGDRAVIGRPVENLLDLIEEPQEL